MINEQSVIVNAEASNQSKCDKQPGIAQQCESSAIATARACVSWKLKSHTKCRSCVSNPDYIINLQLM